MRRLILLPFAVLAVLAVLAVANLAGCGGDGSDDADPTAPSVATQTAAVTSTRAATGTAALTTDTPLPAVTGTPAPLATNTPVPVVPTNTPPPPPPPPPGSITLSLTAASIQFSPRAFTVAAGSSVTIALTNSDQGLPHNVHVFQGAAAGGPTVGMTSIAQGPGTQTLDLGVLSAGPYFFRCDVHPAQMSGSISVQ